MASLVKLRMAKLSIHWRGHGCEAPVRSMRSMVSLRINICDQAQAKRVKRGASSGTVWVGPESLPVAGSRRKTVMVAESWLPQRSHWPEALRVKLRGPLPPQEMRWRKVRCPPLELMEKTTSESSPRLLA